MDLHSFGRTERTVSGPDFPDWFPEYYGAEPQGELLLGSSHYYMLGQLPLTLEKEKLKL